MSKIIRCAIYIRVSSAEQVMHGHSLDAQTRFLSDFATRKGWKVVGIYADEGKTARKELKRRKAIKELLTHVENDEIDMILFWKMDRWFRNVADFYKVQDILDAHDCKWTAAAEPSMNLETREGRLNVNIMLSINQNETDTTSERIKFVNESSVKQGKAIVGTPSMPFGYMVTKVDGVKRVVKDPDKEEIVRYIFDYYTATHSKSGTLKHVNEKFGLNIGPLVIDKMLRSPLFYGSYRNNDNYCPAYITKSQFDFFQTLNDKNIKIYNSRNKSTISPFVFVGLVHCPLCNSRMAGMKRKRVQNDYTYYYRCPKHYDKHICDYSKVLNQDTAENYLLENVERIYNEKLYNNNNVDQQKAEIKKVKNELPKLEKELERLNNMYQKGRISEEKYDSEYDRISALIANCKIIEMPKFRPADSVRKAQEIFYEGWQVHYLTLDAEHRRAFWRQILSDIQLRTDSGYIADINIIM